MTKITIPRAVVEQAIALICSARLCEVNSMSSRQEMLRLMIEATDTLRAALAEPVQEPVCWYDPTDFTRTTNRQTEKEYAPLYTSPPQRPAEPVQEPE